MSSQPLRVALIGAGAIAEFHARAVARVPDAQVVAIVDERVERARALAARHGVARAVADLDEIWLAGVDVVHVLTPPATHAEVTLAALGRGCHVYVEKPLATSAEDCDRIAEAARAAGRTVGVGHSLLRDPSVVKAFDLVRSGAIGDVISVE